jgi:hypothetical protein
MQDQLNEQAFREAVRNYNRCENCPSLKATDGIDYDANEISSKISFGKINILTIKIGLTIRLEKNKFSIDVSNPTLGNGIMSFLYPFL